MTNNKIQTCPTFGHKRQPRLLHLNKNFPACFEMTKYTHLNLIFVFLSLVAITTHTFLPYYLIFLKHLLSNKYTQKSIMAP